MDSFTKYIISWDIDISCVVVFPEKVGAESSNAIDEMWIFFKKIHERNCHSSLRFVVLDFAVRPVFEFYHY